jgi:disulfide bond formation protein DsbB
VDGACHENPCAVQNKGVTVASFSIVARLDSLEWIFMKTLTSIWNRLTPRHTWGLLALGCIGLLAFGAYLQHVVGLEPCPMCIVQRYAMTIIALLSLLALAWRSVMAGKVLAVLAWAMALFGAFVAARQSFLQWYPPQIASCGRDFYGMIESFPLQRAIPLIFRGSGDCSAVDWTFLGGSIANWSFVAFIAMAVWLTLMFFSTLKGPRQAANDEVY